jgi:hypothetical protein
MHHGKSHAVTLFGKRVVISGNKSVHLLSKLGRNLSRLFPEHICEIGFFILPELKTSPGNSFICAKKRLLVSINFLVSINQAPLRSPQLILQNYEHVIDAKAGSLDHIQPVITTI